MADLSRYYRPHRPFVPCAHGRTLARDTCPGCRGTMDMPHAPDLASVVPAWGDEPADYCRSCGQPAQEES